MSETPTPEPAPSEPAVTGPMTPRLLARLFVVPSIIVVMIIGSSVLVVLFFGWISTSQQESVEKLVARIEAGSGDKVLGVALLPKDKEVWQAAMELAQRLEAGHPRAVPDDQKAGIARRLETLLAQARGAAQHKEGQEMQQFLLTALGRLGQASSVELLTAYATDQRQPRDVRRVAISALVQMRAEPSTREAIPALVPLLDDPEPVIRVSATVAVGALARADDAIAQAALTRAYRSSDREVSWNAALALARLGSDTALPLIRDMLTRRYWASQKLNLPGADGPKDPERKLTAFQVENYLLVTIDSAANLEATAVQQALRDLAGDPSAQVRDRAQKALQKSKSSASATQAG